MKKIDKVQLSGFYKKIKLNILNPSLFGVEGGSFFKR